MRHQAQHTTLPKTEVRFGVFYTDRAHQLYYCLLYYFDIKINTRCAVVAQQLRLLFFWITNQKVDGSSPRAATVEAF
ncbi:hypothetical protein AMELA_G00048820 [Ameiurus melas]|uniref:Uncharacterized protein n=1 Tax=Ameiurus melas TaxID=219545 RepID=A0A7J6B509_AMEME|nr:hypothetical protein AMELA_G00048820 [Ameiurus melas]